MKYQLKAIEVEAVQYTKDAGLEDGFAVYETNYPEDGYTFELSENVDTTCQTIIQAAIKTPLWEEVSEGDWIVTYSGGQKEIWNDNSFKDRFQPIPPEVTGLEEKFFVVKHSDIKGKEAALAHLKLVENVMNKRSAEGKENFNRYLVINVDEPYAAEVVEIMKRHGHWG